MTIKRETRTTWSQKRDHDCMSVIPRRWGVRRVDRNTHTERERDGGSERGRGLSPGLSRGVVLTVLKTFFLLTIISLSLSLSLPPSLTPFPPLQRPPSRPKNRYMQAFHFTKRLFSFLPLPLLRRFSLNFPWFIQRTKAKSEFALAYSTNQSKY